MSARGDRVRSEGGGSQSEEGGEDDVWRRAKKNEDGFCSIVNESRIMSMIKNVGWGAGQLKINVTHARILE